MLAYEFTKKCPTFAGPIGVYNYLIVKADVAKLADAPDLGSGSARSAGSIPVIRTSRLTLLSQG
jgi:hypothetical protein